MEYSLGLSTCPNDTFIFDAMIHGKVDTEGLSFKVIMADVEELNNMAFKASVDITKLSYHAYAFAADNYKLLTSGSALGRKNGPLLIAKKIISTDDRGKLKVAIPGKYTTANLLFSIFYPETRDKMEFLFSKIEDAILKEVVDAGVIIHENRFTYRQKGLLKIVDLGEKWESVTGHPIPLGGIAVKREIDPDVQKKINRILKRSVEFAFQHPQSGKEFIKKYAQELDDEVIAQHIALYVNKYTSELGHEGREAVVYLYKMASEKGLINKTENNIFVQ